MDLDEFLSNNEPGRACMVCRDYSDHEAHQSLVSFLERRRLGTTRVTPRAFIIGFLIEAHKMKGCVTTWNTHIRDCLGYGDVFRGGK